MNQTYILLGSNQDDPKVNLEIARAFIEAQVGKIRSQSSLYNTEPWGLKSQPVFINQAIIVDTPLNAIDVLSRCLTFQYTMNADKPLKFGPRIIDVDIIFFNEEIIDTDKLIVPHPRMHERNFVLIPLAEIAGDYLHPIFKKTIRQLQIDCDDTCEVGLYVD